MALRAHCAARNMFLGCKSCVWSTQTIPYESQNHLVHKTGKISCFYHYVALDVQVNIQHLGIQFEF